MLVVVALYTVYPFLTGVNPFNADVPGTDAEELALAASQLGFFRYYGHYFYLLFSAQLYYYLTPAIAMIPAVFMRVDRWFMAWLWVLFAGHGYLRHMLMGSFLPIINYMVFIPLNLFLLSKNHYRWLIVAMFASLMFHGSSGIIIQAGTFLCMVTRFKLRDWIRVAPLAALAVSVYTLNHIMAPSLAAQVATYAMGSDNSLAPINGDTAYSNYLGVIRGNGMLGRFDWANYLPVNWYFYYLGAPLLPALFLIVAAWVKAPHFRQYLGWLVRFTVLPGVVVITWWAMSDMRSFTFDVQDRAANALSIIIAMAAGLSLTALRTERQK